MVCADSTLIAFVYSVMRVEHHFQSLDLGYIYFLNILLFTRLKTGKHVQFLILVCFWIMANLDVLNIAEP